MLDSCLNPKIFSNHVNKYLFDILTLNACKNILVVIQVMDRPLWKHVLRVLNFEWGNPSCYVPVLRALIGDCSFRSIKNNPQGDDKKDEKYLVNCTILSNVPRQLSKNRHFVSVIQSCTDDWHE